MLPIIKNHKSWNEFTFRKSKVWYTGEIKTSFLKKLIKNFDFKQSNLKNFKKEISKLSERFAVIIWFNKNLSVAFVDKIKSFPVFVCKLKNGYKFSNNALSLEKIMPFKDKNFSSVLSIRMSGYSIGRDTIYENLKQLMPGEICIIDKKRLKFISYYSFFKKAPFYTGTNAFLSKKLSTITLEVFKELINKNKDRKIVIPLSGGYDSRLIISVLYHLNAKNIICYSYGKKNNFEAKVAKSIAHELGYPWYFIELNNTSQRINFNSDIYKKYTKYSDTLSSWSYVQDFFAVNKLLSKKVIPCDAVIVNGNTGDFITGGHLPKLIKEENKKRRIDKIFEYIMSKHFSLWENFFTEKDYKIIKKKVLKTFPSSFNGIRKEEEHRIYEYVEFINRQCNYVVQGQRVYDFFNLKWELPLWHDKYLDFWNRVPYEKKYKQSLYKFMLINNNWGNVWTKYPINKHYISPTSIGLLREMLKLFFLFRKNSWSKFDKRYISYFTELVPHYSYFKYYNIIKDKRIARSSVAWHVESYLKTKNLI